MCEPGNMGRGDFQKVYSVCYHLSFFPFMVQKEVLVGKKEGHFLQLLASVEEPQDVPVGKGVGYSCREVKEQAA